MEKLNFKWGAVFNDNTLIQQFDQSGTEHKFQEVLDAQDRLVSFFIKSDLHHCIGIDLINGIIYVNSASNPIQELYTPKQDIRLIYFRRHVVTMGASEKQDRVTHCIGFQYRDVQGNNRKILAQIDEYGNVAFGGF